MKVNIIPLAERILLQDIYVDDVMSNAKDIKTTRKLLKVIILSLKKAVIELHKWSSNSKGILNTIAR